MNEKRCRWWRQHLWEKWTDYDAGEVTGGFKAITQLRRCLVCGKVRLRIAIGDTP